MSERALMMEGDVLEALRLMPDASCDAALFDPPYGIGSKRPTAAMLAAYLRGDDLRTGDFMGRDWSVPSIAVWSEIHRVLRPGAPAFAFAGARTVDLITLGARCGGLDIQDSIAWINFQGWPKAVQIDKAIDALNGDERAIVAPDPSAARRNKTTSKLSGLYGTIDDAESCPVTAPGSTASEPWDGWATLLKPSIEPCIVARKPYDGTIAENALTHGVAGLNVDACRIEYASEEDRAAAAAAAAAQRTFHAADGDRLGFGTFNNQNGPAAIAKFVDKQALGRWPSNVILDELAARVLDLMTGERPGMTGGGVHRDGYRGRTGYGGQKPLPGGIDSVTTARGDTGGGSRFLYCAKASREERMLGVENTHVAVKPVALTRYLAMLALPPLQGRPRRICVPYAGSGSEVVGCLLAGWEEVVAIEREPEYVSIARARLKLATENPRAFEALIEGDLKRGEKVDDRQASLFGGDR